MTTSNTLDHYPVPNALLDQNTSSTVATVSHLSTPMVSFDLIHIQDVPVPEPNTISFDDLQHICNQDSLLETSSSIMETHGHQEDNNYHIDSQMHDGMEEDRIGHGEDDGDEREEKEDEYIPSGIRAGREGGGRGGSGAGIGHGAGWVQNHNWHPDCRRGSRKLNLISGGVARAGMNVSDDDNLDVDVEFNGLANQAMEEGNPEEGHLEGGQGAFTGHPDPSINESQVLSEQARCVILKLSKSCKAILSESSKYYTDASQILEMLVGESPVWNANTAFADNSMEAVASRCQHAERLVSCAKFIHALALIHFRTKVER